MTQQHGNGRRRALIGLTAAVLTVLLVAGLWWLGAFGGRQGLEPRMTSEMTADVEPREVSPDVCGQLHCRSAWETSVGRYVDFENEGDAEYWHQVLGDDARRNGTFLVDMSDRDLSRAQVRTAVDILFAERDWA
ncbi:hypothetical protein GY12_06690 [Micrococcus luteus]|nr:hypothetical protein GY12_06690 [Micrococcus luteus]